jgi:hypothetical protein
MSAIFEAPVSHEAVHETAHEWEWEHPESHEWETHEWESREWESPEAHEWESHEWESPEAHEWESHEWEADPFFGKMFKRLGRGLGSLAKRVAPMAVRALGSMIPGVGAIAGPLLGQLAGSLVGQGEAMAAEVEREAFGGSNGEAEVGQTEAAHETALSELLAAEAAASTSEAEAMSTISATLPLTITIMRAGPSVKRVMPALTQANARVARTLRRSSPQGRQLLRAMPTIQRRAVGTLQAAARAGQPVTAPLAIRSMAQATRSVLGSPRRVEMVVARNATLRRRTAPPSPRRALVYLPQRATPYSPRRRVASRLSY